MKNQFDQYALKGQAKRLEKGLLAMGKHVSYTQALDLVAQMQGKRNWKELSGLAKAQELQDMHEHKREEHWLERLFYVLRLKGINEEDLDDLVHDVIGGERASMINNQGLHEQLRALFEEYQFDRKNLVRAIEESCERQLEMPEGSGSGRIIEGSLMVCYGFPEEAEHLFDAFDWALQASPAELAAVVNGNYRNCDATDEIGLWMEKSAPDLHEREKIHDLLEGMRAIVRTKPDRTGITLDVDEDAFSMFVWLRHYYDGYVFEDSLLKKLDIQAD